MNIANVIGWKFNNQPGMVCRTINGTLQITEFPGGIPSQALQDTWTTEYQAWLANGGKDNQDCLDAWDADKLRRLLLQVNFDQENRIRTLEGRNAVTILQYRTALQTAWRALNGG